MASGKLFSAIEDNGASPVIWYLFACAEFGTYGPIQVLAGLRRENQAHHWGTPSAPSTLRAKERLKELFCPASDAWRSSVLAQSLALVNQALQGLAGTPSSRAAPGNT